MDNLVGLGEPARQTRDKEISLFHIDFQCLFWFASLFFDGKGEERRISGNAIVSSR